MQGAVMHAARGDELLQQRQGARDVAYAMRVVFSVMTTVAVTPANAARGASVGDIPNAGKR
jgi:hypothetical protein